MNINITIHQQNNSETFLFPKNESLFCLLRNKGFIAQTCGSGKCGKCRIKANSIPTNEELEKLTTDEIKNNIRLACYTRAFDGLEVTILDSSPLSVLTNFIKQEYEFYPLLEKIQINLMPPSLEDQEDDISRVLKASECQKHIFSLRDIAEISHLIHSYTQKHAGKEIPLTILRKDNILLKVSQDNRPNLAIAIDIGTTTLAASLINLENNGIIAVMGEANAQSSFGADVISRINQTIEETSPDFAKNIHSLQNIIVKQIETLKTNLLKQAHKEGYLSEIFDDVDAITITGNTTMIHLLCALPAKNISRAPFIPIVTEAMQLKATEINMQSKAFIFIMPSIASYVGSDIVAAMLAINAHKEKEPFLLLDLGTNAEIVLGYNNKFLTCSAAAGPCFEGASISCGIPGQAGAINKVFLNGNNEKGFEYTTINNEKAKGLCGSGVLDILALLLDTGIVDETGAIKDAGEISEETSNNFIKLSQSLITTKDGQKALSITDRITFTQKDIREIQLAKAAVRAGIHTLLDEANIAIKDIKNLYIAGGFGSAMSPTSATKIGLIPSELLSCTKAIGNGASLGVIKYTTEKNISEHINFIIENSKYLELSSSLAFNTYYVEHMLFPMNE